LAAGVNRDTDRRRELAGDTSFLFFVSTVLLSDSKVSYLQFGEGETTSSSNTAVVLDGRASDDGSQLVDWSWRDGCSLCDTGVTTSQLAAGLQNVRFPSPSFICIVRSGLPGRSERGLVAANPCGNLTPYQHFIYGIWSRIGHTVVRDLLVVLDRHCEEQASIMLSLMRLLEVEIKSKVCFA
jgi:hypothetical protein